MQWFANRSSALRWQWICHLGNMIGTVTAEHAVSIFMILVMDHVSNCLINQSINHVYFRQLGPYDRQETVNHDNRKENSKKNRDRDNKASD